jgi:hypothetical protein
MGRSTRDLLDANETTWTFGFVGCVGLAGKSLVSALMMLVDDDA